MDEDSEGSESPPNEEGDFDSSDSAPEKVGKEEYLNEGEEYDEDDARHCSPARIETSTVCFEML